jgi:formate-dependent phosphoribosylglycinamide formyltransferase (GAR transformylase)
MLNTAFVAPYLSANTRQFLNAFANLEGTRTAVISHLPFAQLPEEVKPKLAAHWQVSNAMDPQQLVTACRGLGKLMGGPIERLNGPLEQMQIALGQARQHLQIPGMWEEASRNFREKNRMKRVLREAGVPVARQALVTNLREALQFIDVVGYPIVMKPPAGLGSKATFRVTNRDELEAAMRASAPSAKNPLQAEEFVRGEEHTFEAVTIHGKPVWHSSCYSLPGPLEVLENPWMQYCVLLPREQSQPHVGAFVETNTRALEALGLKTGLSHMEWFLTKDGRALVSEVGARPPGVQILPLLSLAHEANFWSLWARLMVHHTWDVGPRKFATGVAFFRGQGDGNTVKAVRGVEKAQEEAGPYVVDRQLPVVGMPKGSGYEGEGWAIVRHPETAGAVKALKALITNIQVDLG